jgi:hypothetical protein
MKKPSLYPLEFRLRVVAHSSSIADVDVTEERLRRRLYARIFSLFLGNGTGISRNGQNMELAFLFLI